MGLNMSPIEFRARREALGVGQQTLASMLDINFTRISRWENNKQPIPIGMDSELTELENFMDDLVIATIDATVPLLDRVKPPILLVYREDRDLWAASAMMEHNRIPAAFHRVAMARAKTELGPSVRLEYPLR